MRQSHAIIIDAPLERVFAYTEDPGNAPKWADGILRFEVHGDQGTGVGTRYTMVIREGNAENAYEGEVTAWAENEHTQNVIHREGMAMTMDRHYERKEGGTEVTMTVSMALRGGMRLMAPLVWLMNRHFLKRQARALKYYVEREV